MCTQSVKCAMLPDFITTTGRSPGRDECFVVCSNSSLILISASSSGLLSVTAAMARPTSLVLCLVTAQLAGEQEGGSSDKTTKTDPNTSPNVSFDPLMLLGPSSGQFLPSLLRRPLEWRRVEGVARLPGDSITTRPFSNKIHYFCRVEDKVITLWSYTSSSSGSGNNDT